MKNIEKTIELLSPAGNLEKMKTALAHGADAVYAGIPDFSLRVRINDFDMSKIKEATDYCHSIGKKIYITVNIFAHNHHVDKLPVYIKELKKIGVDALIASDPGIIQTIKEVWPKAEIHLSTQANCTNWQSAKFWYEQGVKRIILGREVTLEEIKEIHENVPEVDLEYFVHGAMCMSYSGRCFLSKYFVDRSGNLGDCVQPCRWKYYISEEKREGEPLELVEEQHGSYILNSKDLCLLRHLKELKDAGIISFKIEGRAKSSYYQAVVAGIYAQAIENLDKDDKASEDFLMDELENKITHRGYTKGFLLGEEADQEIEATHKKIDWEFCGVVILHSFGFAQDKPNSSPKQEEGNIIAVKVHNTIKVGDEVEIVRPHYNILRLKIEKMIDSQNGEELTEAHGGAGGKVVSIAVSEAVPVLSVLRRKLR